MADILLALAIWLIVTLRPLVLLFFSLPVTLQTACLTALAMGYIYKFGWNRSVEADYADDLAKAGARRRARLR